MNATLEKFGYPGMLVADYRHWCVLLRPAQVTLGALILGAKSNSTSFAELPPAAYEELAAVTRAVESGLRGFRPFDRINYLMLMMVDPHVHFHVIPRYAAAQKLGSQSFPDPGWPGPPDLKSAPVPDEETRKIILRSLREAWPAT
jgi:diadenosine tetraphosphate (Ap4A) HIT family hydrolase